MFQNYLKIAFRSLLKHPGYSFINIVGLAVGMAVCLLILMHIQNELSYDRYHEKGDRIYRMALERKYPGRSTYYAIVQPALGEAALHEFPEIEAYTRILPGFGNTYPSVRIGDQVFEEKRMYFADSTFFDVFTAPLIEGDPKSALTKANTVVLNESTAKKYFGDTHAALGKTIQVDGNAWQVSGVARDIPERSHFKFDLLASPYGLGFLSQPNYINFAACTYFLLKPGASADALEAKLPQLNEKYVAGAIEQQLGISFEEYTKAGNGYRYFLQPLKDIHLHSNLESELAPNGNIQTVYIFSIIALVILVLACINFTNLSTARSLERAKEVGLRKMFGSERRFLIGQFVTESVLISSFGLVLTFGLLWLLMPVFNSLSGMEFSINYWLDPLRLAGLIGFAIVVGLLAGSYPALVLSSFLPVTVLRGKFKSNKEGRLLRNGLIVFQFFISIGLIICTMIVYQQLQYMQGKKLGFDKEHVIMLDRAGFLRDKYNAFQDALRQLSGVVNVSGTSTMPGSPGFFGLSFIGEGSNEAMIGRGIVVDDYYFKTMGMEMAAGRMFSRDFQDSLDLILNEAAVKEFGLSKNPIGARLKNNDPFLNDPNGQNMYYTVVGVVKDFHFQSLHEKITPLVFISDERFGGGNQILAVRLEPGNFSRTLASIEQLWHSMAPEQPFSYTFLDENLAALYKAEQVTQRVFSFFAGLAIFIACIGLLGLAAYTISQRTKEIGIRKVLGANIGNIVGLLSKDFLKLVGIAAAVAFPIAWWVMHLWLEDFAYRVHIQWWIFLLAGSIAIIVALATVSFQAVRAAVANPVESLRSE